MEKIEDDDQELSRFEQVFEITFSVIGLAVFNFFPELWELAFLQNGEWIFLPALSQKPSLASCRGLTCSGAQKSCWDCSCSFRGSGKPPPAWSQPPSSSCRLGWPFHAAGPSLVGLNPQDMVASGIGFTLETATRLVSLFKQVVTVILAMIIVLDGFSIAKRIYKFAVKRSGS
jgi:hypothetical protein